MEARADQGRNTTNARPEGRKRPSYRKQATRPSRRRVASLQVKPHDKQGSRVWGPAPSTPYTHVLTSRGRGAHGASGLLSPLLKAEGSSTPHWQGGRRGTPDGHPFSRMFQLQVPRWAKFASRNKAIFYFTRREPARGLVQITNTVEKPALSVILSHWPGP